MSLAINHKKHTWQLLSSATQSPHANNIHLSLCVFNMCSHLLCVEFGGVDVCTRHTHTHTRISIVVCIVIIASAYGFLHIYIAHAIVPIVCLSVCPHLTADIVKHLTNYSALRAALRSFMEIANRHERSSKMSIMNNLSSAHQAHHSSSVWSPVRSFPWQNPINYSPQFILMWIEPRCQAHKKWNESRTKRTTVNRERGEKKIVNKKWTDMSMVSLLNLIN